MKLETFLKDFETSGSTFNPEGVSQFVSDWVIDPEHNLQRSCSAPGSAEKIARYSCLRPASAPTDMPPGRVPTPASSYALPSSAMGQHADINASSQPSNEKTGVTSRTYRDIVMLQHGIFLDAHTSTLPPHAMLLAEAMWSSRGSPGPTKQSVASDRNLNALVREAQSEFNVGCYFNAAFFAQPANDTNGLASMGQLMLRSSLPPPQGKWSLICPKPDLLYGYNQDTFTLPQRVALSKTDDALRANASGLLFPFLVVEYRADSGGMWGAESQCMNASAACINLAEKLNAQAEAVGTTMPYARVDSAMFSVVMNAEAARLYISYASGGTEYHTHLLGFFSVQDPDGYIRLRRAARNIIDWGLGQRLAAIQALVDLI